MLLMRHPTSQIVSLFGPIGSFPVAAPMLAPRRCPRVKAVAALG
jgi:hypothetical protein